MANGGQGPAAPGAELERLARQYWNAWQDALQRTMPGAATGLSGFGMPDAFAAPADPWQGVREWCLEQGATDVRVAVLTVKKHDRCIPGVKADYPGVELPDRFVFGFGMDIDETLRTLPAIYAMKQ